MLTKHYQYITIRTMETVKWWLWELKRLHRLWVKPEQSAVDLCRAVGVFWLWRHGARREFKVYPWTNRREWYAIDICLPHKYLGVEADGAPHYTVNGFKKDILRDGRLRERGWSIMRVSFKEIRDNPRGVRKRVRHFLRYG